MSHQHINSSHRLFIYSIAHISKTNNYRIQENQHRCIKTIEKTKKRKKYLETPKNLCNFVQNFRTGN